MAKAGRKGMRAATVLGTALILAVAQSASARDAAARIDLAPSSKLTLRGKSTMHDYASRATGLQLDVELSDELAGGPLPLARLAEPGAVKSIVLTVPVEGLKSEKEGLDKNMYKALKSSANPNIVFRLASATPAANSVFRVAGELEVAGQRRPIKLDVRASETPEGIVLEGSQTLAMPDYGIKPPSMFLGTLKTDPKVVIEWRLVLTSHAVQAAGF
jgi:hypothetical protein